MRQEDLSTTVSLFDQVCMPWRLQEGFLQVWKNKGAPGIDGITVQEFSNNLNEELDQLSKDLQNWSYQPSPVKRVEIAKPDGGVRLLGIPCVRDRVVQATIKILMEPIFEVDFSDNSYGFRPNRSQEQAVKMAQEIVQSGKEYVVDIDLSKFFDRIHHDRLLERIKLKINEPKLLRLIGLILRSGVMKDGLVSITTEGSVQGSPLSPLLSNIVLDELDKELERKGLKFCRFADDCNIFVGSLKAADRVMLSVTKFIEKKLRLVVNQEKSKVALSKFVKFLGMTVILGTLAISQKSMAKAMDRVKELTPRGTHLPMEKRIENVNKWYVGWSNYYKMTQYPSQLASIEAHVRRRLRSQIIAEHKRPKFLFRKLRSRGVRYKTAKVVYEHKGRWKLSHSKAMELAYSNNWFINKMGQKIKSDKNFDHWFDRKKWIKLT
jgi:group II intron reverse transcriptase/maturase